MSISYNPVEKRQTSLALTAKRILLIAHMLGTIWIRRSPVGLIIQTASPFSLLFVLFVVSGGQYIHFAIAGAAIMAIIGVGMSLGGDIATYRIEFKLQDFVIASPVSSLTYMSGVALAQIAYTSPSLAVLSILVVLFSSVEWYIVVPLLLVIILLVWASISALSFFISSRMKHERTTNQMTEVLNIAIAVLPPVFYSIDMLPHELQYLAYAIPTTHAALMMQNVMGLPTPAEWSLWIGVVVQIAYLMGFMLLAKTKGMWRES